jgi:hypothetical protein
MTRFSCHGTRVDLTPLSDGSSETPEKIMLPTREPLGFGGWCSFSSHIAHFSQKSKLYGRQMRISDMRRRSNADRWLTIMGSAAETLKWARQQKAPPHQPHPAQSPAPDRGENCSTGAHIPVYEYLRMTQLLIATSSLNSFAWAGQIRQTSDAALQ